MVDNACMGKKLAIAGLGLGLLGVSQCFDRETDSREASLVTMAPAEPTPVGTEKGKHKRKIRNIIGDIDSAYLNTSDPCLKEAKALNAASTEDWLSASTALESCLASITEEQELVNARNQGILAEYKAYEAACGAPEKAAACRQLQEQVLVQLREHNIPGEWKNESGVTSSYDENGQPNGFAALPGYQAYVPNSQGHSDLFSIQVFPGEEGSSAYFNYGIACGRDDLSSMTTSIAVGSPEALVREIQAVLEDHAIGD